jgi:hypothetical protein
MSKRTWVLASVAVAIVTGSAWAGDQVTIESHGVEIDVPAAWGQVDKGPMTVLAPKTYKGRAIELVSLTAMPDNKDSLQKLLGTKDKITIVKAGPVDRHGMRVIVAEAKAIDNKIEVDVDLVILPVGKGATMVMSFFRGDQDPVLRKANDDLLASARVAGPKMTVEFTPTKTKGQGAPKDFVDKFRVMVPKLDRLFLFPLPLPVRFQDCGAVNAFYSSATHDIKICHELFDDLRALFKKAGIDDKRAEEITLNTVRFAFFHEFGHALVGEFGLSITGKGEDAADELALLTLAGEGKDGEKAALDTAEWFELMVAQSGGKISSRTFFDEHSYDEARVGNIFCMLYGADKVTYAPIVKKHGMPDRRLAMCLKDYPDRRKTWEGLLGPHVRKTAAKPAANK